MFNLELSFVLSTEKLCVLDHLTQQDVIIHEPCSIQWKSCRAKYENANCFRWRSHNVAMRHKLVSHMRTTNGKISFNLG